MKAKMITGVKFVLGVLFAVDLNDVCFWAGLAVLGWGCWMVYEPAAPIVCGLVLTVVGLYGATRKVGGDDGT